MPIHCSTKVCETFGLVCGLGLLMLTELAGVLAMFVAIRQSSVMSPDGGLQVLGVPLQAFLYTAPNAFFKLMGQGFFALLIYLGLIAFGWHAPALPTVSRGRLVGRHARCPCGSGRKYKRCCQA